MKAKETKITAANPESHQYKYCQKTIDMERGARLLYIMLGERLFNIREQRLYEPFWDDWQVFCMEFRDLSPASISKIIKVYEVFILRFGFSPEKLAVAGGWTKLYAISQFATTKKIAEKWLRLAEEQSRQDMGKYLVEAKTGVKMHACKHKDTYMIRVCRGCGERTRVYEE